MDPPAKPTLTLELVPMDPVAPAETAEPAPLASAEPTEPTLPESVEPITIAPVATSRVVPKPADRFLADAKKEFDQGFIDQPLWVRALNQAGGNPAAAKDTYLRSRATALRVQKREARAERLQRRGAAEGETTDSPDTPDTPDTPEGFGEGAASPAPPPPPRAAVRPVRKKSRPPALIGATAVLVALAVGAWFVFGGDDDVPQPGATANAASPAVRPPPAPALPPRAPVASSASSEDLTREFMAKVQSLKDAGNWNVLVLHAVEWTRRQPDNALAWYELSLGYARLRQVNDAYESAVKATQLAPDESRYWRNLGYVNLSANELPAALRAFEQAAFINEKDADSLAQVGLLNIRADRFAEARLAFGKALAADPKNAIALCGEGAIAQRQARKSDAPAKSAKGFDDACRDLAEVASAVNAANDAAAFKVGAQGKR